MLSRRHIRIKVMQALYAFFQSKNDRVDLSEKQMLKSINEIYDLFIYQLSFLTEFFDFSEKRINEAKNKFFPTQEELNPNTKFIDNKIINQLRQNVDLQKNISRLKINWSNEEEMIRKLFLQFKDSNSYINYLNSDDNSYNAAKQIIISLIKNNIAEFDALQFYYEDKNIHWSDDYYTVLVLLVNIIKSYNENWDEFHTLPGIYKDSIGLKSSEDKKMAIDIFRKTIVHSSKFDELITAKAKNWEYDRIAKLDIIIIKMAISEFIEFP